jgi:hypothetical protein
MSASTFTDAANRQREQLYQRYARSRAGLMMMPRSVWVVAERWEGAVRGIFENKRSALLWRMRDKCNEAMEARQADLKWGGIFRKGCALTREERRSMESGSDHGYASTDYVHDCVVYEREVQP